MKITLIPTLLVCLAACRGPVGPTGPQGDPGEPGDPGRDGIQGAQGPAGPAGQRSPGAFVWVDATGHQLPGMIDGLLYLDDDNNLWATSDTGLRCYDTVRTLYFASYDCTGQPSYMAVRAGAVVEFGAGDYRVQSKVVGPSQTSFRSTQAPGGDCVHEQGEELMLTDAAFAPVQMPAVTIQMPVHLERQR